MCKNATTQVANLMAAELPTLDGLMAAVNVPASDQANVNAVYTVAEGALANWVPGTTSETIDEALNAALAAVVALKPIIPPEVELLFSLAVGGIEAVIGIVEANNKPTAAEQKVAADAAVARVQVTVPSFKLSWVDNVKAAAGDTHVAANHYKHEWNKAVDEVSKVEPKYASLYCNY
jgi:hypothetical protein